LFQDIEKDDDKDGEDDSEKKKLPDVAEKKRGRPKKVCFHVIIRTNTITIFITL
jgi:hypothetical protein